jgi:hypothetical protein
MVKTVISKKKNAQYNIIGHKPTQQHAAFNKSNDIQPIDYCTLVH